MRVRSLPPLVALLFLAVPLGPALAASDTATGQIVVTAQFGSRTSLRVSTQLLQFDVVAPDQPATIAVDFSAGARTALGAEVVLTVEPQGALDGPGGASDVEAALSFSGEGDGTLAGVLNAVAPAAAARWNGSGLRTGRVVFALRAPVSGAYSLPVRFVLSTP